MKNGSTFLFHLIIIFLECLLLQVDLPSIAADLLLVQTDAAAADATLHHAISEEMEQIWPSIQDRVRVSK